MTGKCLAGLLLVCLIAGFASSSSLQQEETSDKKVRVKLQEDIPLSRNGSNALPKFHRQPRSRIRQPRSDASPSINEAVVDQLIQKVGQLSASIDFLTHQVWILGTHNEALHDNVTELQSKNSALSVELGQSTQTIQQQTTALEAALAQFAAFRGEVSQASQEQNKTLSQTIRDVADITTKLGRVEGIQNLTGSRLLVHDHNLTQFDQRVTSLERRTTHTEKDTDILEHWRVNVTDDVTKINVTHAQLVNDVNNLKEGGRQVSGVSSQLQTDLSQLQAKFASSTRSVVFYARLSQSTKPPVPHPPFPIILGQVLTNQGDAYNATSGNFTVPVDGDYFFAAISISSSSGLAGAPLIELMVDEDGLSISNPYHSTVEAALRLRAGQRVWLRSYFGSTYGRGMYFTGYHVIGTLPHDNSA